MITSLKKALSGISITNAIQATLLKGLIPSTCPFARTIHLGTYKLVIPPLCKINPLYEELMLLRYKADCYLAETYNH
jgi:hypothetical protein